MYINGKWFSETEVKAHVSELERKVSEFKDKHWSECGQIARYEDELREAKRIIDLARSEAYRPYPEFVYRFETEAKKLLGEESSP